MVDHVYLDLLFLRHHLEPQPVEHLKQSWYICHVCAIFRLCPGSRRRAGLDRQPAPCIEPIQGLDSGLVYERAAGPVLDEAHQVAHVRCPRMESAPLTAHEHVASRLSDIETLQLAGTIFLV